MRMKNKPLQKERKSIKRCREMKLKAKGNYAKIRPFRRTVHSMGKEVKMGLYINPGNEAFKISIND